MRNKGDACLEILFALLVGTATGILSAFGVGGGTLLLIYLSVFTGVPQQTAQGINLLYFLPASLASLPSHFKNGFIDRTALLPAILCGLISTALFAFLATELETGLMRRFFGVFLLVIGLYELFGYKTAGEDARRPNTSHH